MNTTATLDAEDTEPTTKTPDSKENGTLLMYVNDVLALERAMKEAVERQVADASVREIPEAIAFLEKLAPSTEDRLASLSELSDKLGSGAAGVKEAVAAAAGMIAGLYGKVRKHAVSRMLRDDHTALGLASTAYSMLYTTAVALHDGHTAAIAQRHLREVTPLIMGLSHVLPAVVVAELAADFPDLNREATEAGREATRRAWSQDGESGS